MGAKNLGFQVDTYCDISGVPWHEYPWVIRERGPEVAAGEDCVCRSLTASSEQDQHLNGWNSEIFILQNEFLFHLNKP